MARALAFRGILPCACPWNPYARRNRFLSRASGVSGAEVGIAALSGRVDLTGVRLHADPPTAAMLYFFLIVLASLRVAVVPALAIAILAIGCLDFFFTAPLFEWGAATPMDAVAVIGFSTTSLIITRLMTTVRRSLAEVRALQHQLELVVENVPALIWRAAADGSCDVPQRSLAAIHRVVSAIG